jgi:hypothetical protein
MCMQVHIDAGALTASICMSAFTVAGKPALSCMLSRVSVLKPGRLNDRVAAGSPSAGPAESRTSHLVNCVAPLFRQS